MASSKYIKTKSNYVFKSQHQKTSGGTVFERDFMTVSSFDAMSPAEKQVYGLNNFKFQISSTINEQKKHNNGRWISDSEIVEGVSKKKDGGVKLNPDYESLKDFAYYGSAINLVKASIVDIILNFPAELYFSRDVYPEKVNGGTSPKYYVVSNDYGIDVATEIEGVEDIDNPLRYLTKSIGDYVVYTSLNQTGVLHEVCKACISVIHFDRTCEEISAGAIVARSDIRLHPDEASEEYITLYTYQIGGETVILYDNEDYFDYRIRPNADICNSFFDNLSGLEAVLLNRNTNPIYTATFNTPYETEKGFLTYKRDYIWPSAYGWNPDISSQAYDTYLEGLISLASYHDEYDCDNIWRSMTHEAIKNLDWTFTREKDENTTEYEKIDSTKIEPILKVYGRQYDELKRYADVIAKSGNVSYDKKNNIPDSLLGSALDSIGWEVSAVNTGADNVVVQYGGGNITYDKDDVNTEFYRRLRVNSTYLNSMKGTKKGLVSMLGLFGLTEGVDYKINEYIAIAGPVTTTTEQSDVKYPLYEKVAKYNRMKYNFDYTSGDDLFGLPVKMIPCQVVNNGETVDCSYVVPWYERNKKYDNGLYFQMKGGWAKTNKMKVNNTDFSQYRQYIEENEAFKIFEETISNLKYAQTLDDMLELGKAVVKTGDVCYVTDLSGFSDKYNNGPSGDTTIQNTSHYFYLEDADYSRYLGYVDDVEDNFGWKAVKQADLINPECSDKEVLKVLYLESIVDSTSGNNPHMGHSSYDAGSEYMKTMITPFKPALDGGNLEPLSDEELEDAMASCSFTSEEEDGRIDCIVDNKKCWYFTDRLMDLPSGALVTCDTKVREIVEPNEYDTGEIPVENTLETTGSTVLFDDGVEPINPEGDETNDVAAANSVINSKRLSITFKMPTFTVDTEANENEYSDFITNKVLFYLKQLIPATTLFEYEIVSQTEESNEEQGPTIDEGGVVINPGGETPGDEISTHDPIDDGGSSQVPTGDEEMGPGGETPGDEISTHDPIDGNEEVNQGGISQEIEPTHGDEIVDPGQIEQNPIDDDESAQEIGN